MNPNDIAEVAERLVTHGEAIGARARVGIAETAVNPDGYLFAVLNHRGQTMVLVHDAFEAARQFVGIESQMEWDDGDHDARPVVVIPSDASVAADAFGFRCRTQHRFAYGARLDRERAQLAAWDRAQLDDARADLIDVLASRDTP